MQVSKEEIIRIYTTPKELRAIADRMEKAMGEKTKEELESLRDANPSFANANDNYKSPRVRFHIDDDFLDQLIFPRK